MDNEWIRNKQEIRKEWASIWQRMHQIREQGWQKEMYQTKSEEILNKCNIIFQHTLNEGLQWCL